MIITLIIPRTSLYTNESVHVFIYSFIHSPIHHAHRKCNSWTMTLLNGCRFLMLKRQWDLQLSFEYKNIGKCHSESLKQWAWNEAVLFPTALLTKQIYAKISGQTFRLYGKTMVWKCLRRFYWAIGPRISHKIWYLLACEHMKTVKLSFTLYRQGQKNKSNPIKFFLKSICTKKL